mmetsp:Transcript_45510/g.67065  ORF Transcript_45510/g.67065 Transcript_45510/m.67065 type:complete len:285 (-) Transcript_45510:75-929(-)
MRTLLIISSTSMTTLNILPVVHLRCFPQGLCLLQQRPYHFTSMSRVYPIITRGCCKEHLGAYPIGVVVVIGWRPSFPWHAKVIMTKEVIRRMTTQILPFLWFIRISIFCHPGRTGEQMGINLHIEQRHLTHGSTKDFRRNGTSDKVSNHEPTVRSTNTSQFGRAGDLTVDQILCHRFHVFIAFVTVFFQRSLMPFGAILSPTANVGDDFNASLFEPRSSNRGGVARKHGNFESTIGIEKGWVISIEYQILASHHEVGYFGSILGTAKVLLDAKTIRVEHGRFGL